MAEQEMLLDSATIKAAVAGEKWATEKVIEHYAPMIDMPYLFVKSSVALNLS